MQTVADGEIDKTVPDPIADLGPDIQAMFERVRVALGMREARPEMIGRYELHKWIARGGMGEVYRAFDTDLERKVAVKFIFRRPGSDIEVLRKRLHREALAQAKIDHENVVKVYDAGVHDGRAYLVMELVEGETLRALQRDGELSRQRYLELYAEAGRGLSAAHEQGVTHRDFKPDNVFVGEDGRARVGDFGLAYLLEEIGASPGEQVAPEEAGAQTQSDGDGDGDGDGDRGDKGERLTREGELLGTMGYMAPEQLRGEAADSRADQYAFCVALWEALAGRRPFEGRTKQALLRASTQPPRGGEGIDRRLRRVLRIGLAAEPDQRHESLATIVAAIEEVLGRRKRRINRGGVWVLGVVALVATVGYALARTKLHPPCPVAETFDALGSDTDWVGLRGQTSAASVARLQGQVAGFGGRARDACVSHDLAALQHLESLAASLGPLLTVDDDGRDEHWKERLANFEFDRASRSLVPMTGDGYEVLSNEIAPLEADWDLEELVALCEDLDEREWAPVDRAEILLHCGRARSLTGDKGKYESAVEDFLDARGEAEVAGDRQRRLSANLGAAKTVITRLQDYDRGAGLLMLSGELLRALDAGSYDRRRTEFLELQARLIQVQGDLDQALAMHRRVIRRHVLVGTRQELVTALVWLGNLHDVRGEPLEAEVSYRLALELDPNDLELVCNFGRFLVNEQRRLEEAQALLERVAAGGNRDLHLIAVLSLFNIVLDGDEFGNVDSLKVVENRNVITKLLLDPQMPRTPEHEYQAWLIIAWSYIQLGDDLGPQYWGARRHLSSSDKAELDGASVPPLDGGKGLDE